LFIGGGSRCLGLLLAREFVAQSANVAVSAGDSREFGEMGFAFAAEAIADIQPIVFCTL